MSVHWWELWKVPSYSKPYFFLHKLLIWPTCGDVLSSVMCDELSWIELSSDTNVPHCMATHIWYYQWTRQYCYHPLLILKVLIRIKQSYFDGFVLYQSYFDCFVQNQAVLFCQFVPNQAVSFCQFCSKLSNFTLMVLFQIKESYSDILFRIKWSHFDCFVQILAVLLCRFVQNQAVLFCQLCS